MDYMPPLFAHQRFCRHLKYLHCGDINDICDTGMRQYRRNIIRSFHAVLLGTETWMWKLEGTRDQSWESRSYNLLILYALIVPFAWFPTE